MFKEPTILDEADLKAQFRNLYRTQGAQVCLQCIYEIVKSGEWFSQVLREEMDKENSLRPGEGKE